MNNCISINLKKNEIIIKIAEDAKQEQILNTLRKKLPELKKTAPKGRMSVAGFRRRFCDRSSIK